MSIVHDRSSIKKKTFITSFTGYSTVKNEFRFLNENIAEIRSIVSARMTNFKWTKIVHFKRRIMRFLPEIGYFGQKSNFFGQKLGFYLPKIANKNVHSGRIEKILTV